MLGCSVTNSSLSHLLVRLARHRQIAEPEVVAESSEDSDEGTWHPEREESSEDEEEEEEEVDDEVGVSSLYCVLSVVEFCHCLCLERF